MSEDSLEARLHQMIGSQHALNEVAQVVDRALAGAGIEDVVRWLNDKKAELRSEIDLLTAEARSRE
jgi:hypothetical protein